MKGVSKMAGGTSNHKGSIFKKRFEYGYSKKMRTIKAPKGFTKKVMKRLKGGGPNK